jgi:hypothetical protein
MEKTCLHRFLGECKGCVEDYEPISPTHPCNNLSCKKYYEMHYITSNTIVVELSLTDKIYVGLGHIFGRNGDLKEGLLKKKIKEMEIIK